jgi:hypothetical protein
MFMSVSCAISTIVFVDPSAELFHGLRRVRVHISELCTRLCCSLLSSQASVLVPFPHASLKLFNVILELVDSLLAFRRTQSFLLDELMVNTLDLVHILGDLL